MLAKPTLAVLATVAALAAGAVHAQAPAPYDATPQLVAAAQKKAYVEPFEKSGAAKVVVVEPTGAEIHIYADLAGEEVCAVTQDRLRLEPGDEVRLVPLLDRVHLFDQATGKSLAA